MKKIFVLSLLAAVLAVPALSRAEDEAPEQGPCKADVQKFCKDVTPGGGRVIACLKAHEDKLSPECKAAGQKAKERVAQARKDFDTACADDRQKLCKDAKPGREMMMCFHEHENDLSEGCKSMIEKHKRKFMAAHPKMAAAMKACKADREKFCKDVKPGEGRVMDCMKQHESELSGECRDMMSHHERMGGKSDEGPEGDEPSKEEHD